MSDYPETFDHMLAAWNEREPAKVRGHLEQALAPDVRFVDPDNDITGIDAFESMVHAFHEKLPDAVCSRASGVDSHHQLYRYEKRRMRYDRGDPLELQTSEKLLIEVDYYAVWRIADPERYFKSIRTRDAALRRLDTVTYSAVQQTLARHTLADLLSEKREEISRTITRNSIEGLRPDGIEVLDLRIRRTVYPEANLPQVYSRMRTERNRFAMKFRAEGEEQSRAIRSAADRESLIIVSTAERDSAKLRGEGDAEATRIYAEAFGQDTEFYEFLRTLEAYKLALNDQTTLILSPDAPFLKYLFDHDPMREGSSGDAP